MIRAHGGLVHEELAALGIAPEDVLDFSVNVNPYGPCRELREAVARAPIDRYPDPVATPARNAIANWLDVPPECVLVANGAVEVFWLVSLHAGAVGGSVLIAEPAFSEMRAAAEHAGARVVACVAGEDTDFAFDEAVFAALLRRERPALAYLATPSNPGGALVDPQAIRRLAEGFPTTHMVADVSFLGLGAAPDDRIVHSSSRVLWVRSLTKELSVPGLRVGFAVGPPALIARLERSRPPWSVGAPAEAAAIAATTPAVRRFVDGSREALFRDRDSMTTALVAQGLRVHPSATTFVLSRLPGERTGAELRRALLERHSILVRDAASFGLPHHIRLAARPSHDVERLVHALKQELVPGFTTNRDTSR